MVALNVLHSRILSELCASYAVMVHHVIFHGPCTCIFSVYTRAFIGECIFKENTNDKWDLPWYIMRKCGVTILYHAKENT